jgi:hypothetical protein
MVTSSPTTVNAFTPPQPAAIRVTSNGRGGPVPYGRIHAPLGRIKHGERIVHVVDIWEEEVYRAVPTFRRSVELRGTRSQLRFSTPSDIKSDW